MNNNYTIKYTFERSKIETRKKHCRRNSRSFTKGRTVQSETSFNRKQPLGLGLLHVHYVGRITHGIAPCSSLMRVSCIGYVGLGTVRPGTIRPRMIRPVILKNILYKKISHKLFHKSSSYLSNV